MFYNFNAFSNNPSTAAPNGRRPTAGTNGKRPVTSGANGNNNQMRTQTNFYKSKNLIENEIKHNDQEGL